MTRKEYREILEYELYRERKLSFFRNCESSFFSPIQTVCILQERCGIYIAGGVYVSFSLNLCI